MPKVKGQKLEQQTELLVFLILFLLMLSDSSQLVECNNWMLHPYVQYVTQEKQITYCQKLLYKNFHNFLILPFNCPRQIHTLCTVHFFFT